MDQGIGSRGRRIIAEVISIGDELTTGQRLDTNSQWLSQRLGELGIAVHFHSTVSDEMPAMECVFRVAINRADIVVVTGGLGPTADDLTRDAIASVTGKSLILDEGSLEAIRERFRARGREMPANNRQQAMFPAGSRVIPNLLGTAPGIEMGVARPSEGRAWIFSMPGVPAEMKPMWHEQVVPAIGREFPDTGVVVCRSLCCFGVGESDLEMRLPDLIRRGREPVVGITASSGIITLRIMAHGKTEQFCHDLIAPVEQVIHDALGDIVFGTGNQTLESTVIQLLQQLKQTLAIVDFGLSGTLAMELFHADPTGEIFRGDISGFGDLKGLQAAMLNAKSRFGVSIVLGVGRDEDRNNVAHRDALILQEGEFQHFSLKPIRNSTIGISHSAKQAVNLLRKLLLRSELESAG